MFVWSSVHSILVLPKVHTFFVIVYDKYVFPDYFRLRSLAPLPTHVPDKMNYVLTLPRDLDATALPISSGIHKIDV